VSGEPSPSPSQGEGGGEGGAPSGGLGAGATIGWSRGRVRLGFGLMILVGLVLPWFVYPVFLMNVLCMALFASAFNLLLGYAGLLSFGHAAFLGAAGYVTGQAVKVWGLPTELGILAGTAAATLLGAVFGALAIRRAGIYFAMITLGLSQVVYFLAVQMQFTGGDDGLQGIPRGSLLGVVDLGDRFTMYYFVFAIFLLGFWVVYRTIHSPFGHVLRSIRENEPRALSLGYDVDRYKLVAFVISAALSGLAGATKALVFQAETLTDIHWHMSGAVVLMTLLGGMGTVLGPSVGALIVLVLQNYLSGFGSWVTVITGVVFVVGVLAFRRGFVGEAIALAKKFPF
jgi:branched-chain amino acid transport system permease protein